MPLFKGKWKQAYLIIPPCSANRRNTHVYGVFGEIPSLMASAILRIRSVFGRVDKLSFLFALAFSLASVPVMIYSLHVKSSSEHMCQLVYAGSALGVVFAGDLITLYFFWEIMSVASMLVIWHGATENAHSAGFRYIMWHIAGGIILLAGIVIYIASTGSITFDAIGWSSSSTYLAAMLIFLGFIINAGFLRCMPGYLMLIPSQLLRVSIFEHLYNQVSRVCFSEGLYGFWAFDVASNYGYISYILCRPGE